MTIDEANMWDYWCDKYGPVEALKVYYSHLLLNDSMLRAAVAQIEIAELAIRARMDKLVAEAS